MNETDATTPPPTVPPAERRVSTLIGDRLCERCGYNLVGQTVVRESHYDMLIVRCPECATVASIQEYPLLGRWASRWGMVLAGLWFLLLLALLFVPPIAIVAAAYGYASGSVAPIVERLGESQEAWAIANDVPQPEQQQWRSYQPFNQMYWQHTPVLQQWWNMQDRGALLASYGGWMRMTDWTWLRPWTYAMLPLAAYGFVLSLCVPHIRRRWLPLVGLIVGGVCLAYWMLPMTMVWAGFVYTLGDAAFAMIGYRVALVLILSGLVPLLIGLLLGRTLARLIVRALLPPRLRGSLALLWTIDGLTPPLGGGHGRRA